VRRAGNQPSAGNGEQLAVSSELGYAPPGPSLPDSLLTAHLLTARRGLTYVEYAIMIAVIVAALIAVQRLLLGAMNGRWKEAGDTFSAGQLYDPETETE